MLESTMWQGLCLFVGVPTPLAKRLWAGLCRATWSEATALREAFVSHEPVLIPWLGKALPAHRGSPEALASQIATPAVVLKALRNCATERVITQGDMGQIGGIILAWMAFDEAAAQSWDATHQPLWVYGPRPDFSRWRSKAERLRSQH